MATSNVYFNPEEHPKDTLKEFKEFCKLFSLRYDAQFPDPPKSSLDVAIHRWTIQNRTAETPNPQPTLDDYDNIRDVWRSKDKVAKIIGMFSGPRLSADWEAAEPNEAVRKASTYDEFKEKMIEFYKPTENETLIHYEFRDLHQKSDESFISFCNRVVSAAKMCNFKCDSQNCSVQETIVRDQIVIGTKIAKIREEALEKSWKLDELKKTGMKIESAARGEAEIAGTADVKKLGAYSKINQNYRNSSKPNNTNNCYNCGNPFKGPGFKHKEFCKARNYECLKCGNIGHFTKYCKNKRKPVNFVPTVSEEPNEPEDESFDVQSANLFRVQSCQRPVFKRNKMDSDFSVQVGVNGKIIKVVADTGAKVSVCGSHEAQKWNLLEKMTSSSTKIKPYNSNPIPVSGVAKCAVTFGLSSIPVDWHIIRGSCEPILSGQAAVDLGIINFSNTPPIYQPIHMIDSNLSGKDKEDIQSILTNYPENFQNKIGKHTSYQVKLHVDSSVKPIVTPPTPTPYHLVKRIERVIDEMLKNDVIEEHPTNQPAPWVSRAVIVPKSEGGLRITLDARNINKAIQSSNLPIPRQEDIKAKLSGAKIFSKLDFRSAFWQLELAPESRYLTVFNLNGKLYRYKRLTMGVKPAQGELNTALKPLFEHIPGAHLIHDDLILAASNMEEHNQILDAVMKSISNHGLTLQSIKCEFGKKEIKFWGMIINEHGVSPDPEKVSALKYLEPPKNKAELISFLCMMQSNSDFIPQFAKKASFLRELTKNNVRFKWTNKHQEIFLSLLQEFKSDVTLRYFDISKPIFVVTDAHVTGLGATLAQGDSLENAKPIAFASRKTTSSEKRYPQLDLEGLAVDFGLRKFRNYLIGAPHQITVVTDHMPLCSVFNGSRCGSIRTERFKQKHQDIRFKVIYQKGKSNQTDFLSRRATPIDILGKAEIKEAEETNNILYMLHTTPVTDKITLKSISEETVSDPVLSALQKLILKGQTWIPKTADPQLQKFRTILPEITVTGNGILLKSERIILPPSLQSKAIELCHQGSHPGQSAMERRLRFHFFFHDMSSKISSFLNSCIECKLFTDKKISEPMKSHEVPKNCMEKVSVDLFGPIPSGNHIIVAQDLASRYPSAKVISSTSSKQVIPALTEIYDHLGNPEIQLSDNGPPFNSKEMRHFADNRGIQLQYTPPYHPSANPVESFMRPLGKSLKIANYSNVSEKDALNSLMKNYRNTPHPATGISPNHMLFNTPTSDVFPRKFVSEEDIQHAKKYDHLKKQIYEDKINSTKYIKNSNILVGDTVIIRNYKKQRKFDPIFHPDQYIVLSIRDFGRRLELERLRDGKLFSRHPNDVKKVHENPENPQNTESEQPMTDLWKEIPESDSDGSFTNFFRDAPVVQNDRRYPQRRRRPPEFLGGQLYNEHEGLPGEEEVIRPWWPGYPRGDDV